MLHITLEQGRGMLARVDASYDARSTDSRVRVRRSTTPGCRNEAAFVAAAQAGGVESFEELVAPYEGRLYRTLLRMVGSEADAQDVLQETLFNAFKKIGSFRAESAFGTWFYRIGVNQALMWLRRMGSDPLRVADTPLRFDLLDAHARPIADWSTSVEDGALRAEARRVLSQAVSDLPEIDRAVVLLKDAEGLSHEEIAEATGLTVVATRSRLHRSRLVLRERLSEYFRDRDEAVPAKSA